MILASAVERIYRSRLFTRYDETGTIFRFSAGDFPGLEHHPYAFRAGRGHILRGWFYHYPDPIPGRLVVFDHGLGGGHRSYMREIEMLCRHGYLVFSYDHSGCMESEGEDTGGFGRSLSDLDACLTALKKEPMVRERAISVMGHSWGGFSTMNIAALHPDVRHVVAMSGFISVDRMLSQIFAGPLKLFRKGIYALEQSANPRHWAFTALDTLKNTSAQVLLIHSGDDPTVKCAEHFEVLEKALPHRENIRFLRLTGKKHNPNYTSDAVAYMESYFAELNKKNRKKQLQTDQAKADFLASWDWKRMTEQDETVWREIFRCLD